MSFHKEALNTAPESLETERFEAHEEHLPKSMPKAIKLLLGGTALAAAAALGWMFVDYKPALGTASPVAEPWQAALMQQQEQQKEALQAERDSLAALTQALSLLQSDVRSGMSRLDDLQGSQARLRQEVSGLKQDMAQMQAGAAVSAEQVSQLLRQFSELDERVTSLATAAAKPPAAVVATKPAASTGRTTAARTLIPPFRVLELEYRGGERFLSVAPRGSTSLSDIRLLREGDSLSGWQLSTLSAQQAVFAVGGRKQAVSLRTSLSLN